MAKNPWTRSELKEIPIDQSKVVGDTAKHSGWSDIVSRPGGEIEIDQDSIVQDDGKVHPVEADEITEEEIDKFWAASRKPEYLVYVCGPMRGIPDFNFLAFDEARDFINEATTVPYRAISPADMDRESGFELEDGAPVTEEFFQECMRRDLEVITRAHAILLLKGWQNSTGANNELFVARACGVHVWEAIYLDGKIAGWTRSPEWLRSPLIYGDNGRPETFGFQLNLPVSTSKWAADRLENMTDERTVEEVDQTLSLPPTAENLTYGRTAEATLSSLKESEKEKKDPTEENILQEADRLIHGERNHTYGTPLDDFTRSGKIIGAIIGELHNGDPVPPEKVGLIMAGVKIGRECNGHKRDNLTDLAGYAGTIEMVISERERRGQ